MAGDDILAVVLIAMASIGWVATVILVRAANRMRLSALTERAVVSIILSLRGTVLAIFAFTHLIRADLPAPALGGFIVLLFLTISLPDVIWLTAYWRGWFNA